MAESINLFARPKFHLLSSRRLLSVSEDPLSLPES